MKSELLNYLENIITLEKTVYIQGKTIDAIDANLRNLGIPAEIEQRRTEKRTTGVLGNAC